MLGGATVLLVFWVVSLLALLFFVVIPYVASSQAFANVWSILSGRGRVTERQPIEQPADAEAVATDSSQAENGDFHYVVSKVQEAEIRESYLMELLRHYSKKLSASDIKDSPASQEFTIELGDDSGTESDSPTASTIDESDIEKGDARCDEEDEDDDVDFMGENGTTVKVPVAGHEVIDDEGDNEQKDCREVPNGCAICLSLFKPDDRISWSSNPDCSHVFHHDCVLDWLKTNKRKKSRRQRDAEQIHISDAVDPVKWITRGNMACPCCRRDFVVRLKEEEDTSPIKVDSTDLENAAGQNTAIADAVLSSPTVVAPV
ncbi:hypothetical protein MPSEU_000887300 [Mayamaea pseudoterrestris]|nr:hypothetical protein MPSEU_000887300 [Mayamaea pseudoterrestris]